MARLACLLFWIIGAAAHSLVYAAPILVNMETPRSVGWMHGDVIVHHLDIESPPNARLHRASLPPAGPLNYWLDLRSVSLDAKEKRRGNQYRLTLEYQTFYVPLDVNVREIPPVTLQFGQDGETLQTLTLPAWTFSMSPLRPVSLTRSASLPTLQDDITATLPVLRPHVMNTAGWLSGIVGIGLLLAGHHGVWPFRRGRARPLMQARRQIRRLHRQQASHDNYATALRTLHTALARSHTGGILMYEDLPAFVQTQPAFAPLLPRLERVFTDSQRVFFGRGALSEPSLQDAWDALLELTRLLASVERQVRL
ncbi:MAG TPA: hypothetical protein VKZ71_04510 [Burkholderiaceae bacterium]|nr:hypothetical protein [Burkholderiaceae bacterium]